VFDTFDGGQLLSAGVPVTIPIRDPIIGPFRVARDATGQLLFGITANGLVMVRLPTLTNPNRRRRDGERCGCFFERGRIASPARSRLAVLLSGGQTIVNRHVRCASELATRHLPVNGRQAASAAVPSRGLSRGST